MRNVIKGDFDKGRNYDAVMELVAEEEKIAIKKRSRKKVYFSIGLIAACITLVVFAWMPVDKGVMDKNGNQIFINEVGISGVAKLDADADFDYNKSADGRIRGQKVLSFNLPEIEGMSPAGNSYVFTENGEGIYNILHDQVYDFQSADGSKDIHLAISDKGVPLRDYFFGGSETIPSKIKGIEVTIAGSEQFYYALFQVENIYIDLETNGVSQNQTVEIIEDIITANNKDK